MKKKNSYKPGDYYVTCDVTGKKMLRSQCHMQWDGLLVDKKHYEERQPQDFVEGRADRQEVENPRPGWETDTFLTTNEVTVDDL